MRTTILSFAAMLSLSAVAVADHHNKTPGDLSNNERKQMSELVTAYNQCMMQGRLKNSREGMMVQEKANEVLQSCESDLKKFSTFLADNDINDGLAEGMTKRMRSRAARQMMTNRMNSLAEQAQAAENVEKDKPQAE